MPDISSVDSNIRDGNDLLKRILAELVKLNERMTAIEGAMQNIDLSFDVEGAVMVNQSRPR